MNRHGESPFAIAFVVIFVLAMVGWFLNLFALFSDPSMSGMTIARAIGVVVVPLGALLGYF